MNGYPVLGDQGGPMEAISKEDQLLALSRHILKNQFPNFHAPALLFYWSLLPRKEFVSAETLGAQSNVPSTPSVKLDP